MANSDSLDDLRNGNVTLTPDFTIDDDGNADFHGNRGVNLGDPVDDDDATNKGWVEDQIALVEGSDVDSFNGRTGVVVPASGDYTATQVTNTPAGGVAAVTVQAALDELDSEKQPLDTDLTVIAGLSPSNDDLLQRKSGAWTNRTPAQVKTDLVLVKGDVGLGNADNTSDLAKPISTATQTALDLKLDDTQLDTDGTLAANSDLRIATQKAVKTYADAISSAGQPLDSDLTAIAGLSPSNDDIIQRKSGAWINRTPAQLKTDLVLVKADVGLANVDNTSDVTKNSANVELFNKTMSGLNNTFTNIPESAVTSLVSDLALKAPLASPALTGTPTAPTASASDNSTKIATTAYADTAVANLVDSAPGTLDTLNELAAALGDDPNFATTVASSIAGKQPLDAELSAIAGLTSAVDKGIQFTGSGTAGTYDLTTAGKALLDDTDAAAQLVTLGLSATATELNFVDGVTSAIQTQLDTRQPLDADLTAIGQLTSAADRLPYATGAGTWALTDFTAFARTLVDDADAATMRTTLGVGADSLAMHLAGAETVTGVKTFNAGTFLDKGSRVYDVRAVGYAAVLDGVTDDRAAIQAAIDAASAAGGGDVMIAKPTVVNAPLEMKDNVRLRGIKGLPVSITSSMTSSSERGILNITGRTNIAIEDLKLVPNGGSTAITSYGHNGLYITNVEITGTTTTADTVIQLSGGSSAATGVFANTVIDGVYFHDLPNTDNCIRLYSRNAHTITTTEVKNCRFDGTTKYCVMLDAYDTLNDTYIHNNRCTDVVGDMTNSGALFWTRIDAKYIIDGIWVDDNDYVNTLTTAGITQGFGQFYGTKNVRITRNRMKGSWTPLQNTIGPAIAPGRIRRSALHTLIADNTIEGFDAAWDPDSMIDCNVHDNKVLRCGSSFGIGYGYQQDVTIHHNYNYNSPHLGSVNSLTALGASDSGEKNCSLFDNTYIDDRPVPVPTGVTATIQSGGSLTAATTYYYVVTACDPSGETVKSTEVSALTDASNKRIRVFWTSVTGASLYKIYRTTSSGTYGATSFLTSTNDYEHYDDGLTALTTGEPPAVATVEDCPTVRALFFHGGAVIDHSNTLIARNKFYLPRSTFTSLVHKELSDSVLSRVIENNEYEDSTGRYREAPYAQGNVSGATTFTRANGPIITCTLTGDVTAVFTNGTVVGETMEHRYTQDGTGGRTITTPANARPHGGSIPLSTTAGAMDVYLWRWDGTYWRGVWRSITTPILPITQGGTGSATQNFVDLTTGQTVAGAKVFSSVVTAPAAGYRVIDNNTLTIDDQTTYRRIQSFAGVPLALNPGGNSIIFNGTTSLKAGSVSFVGQNMAFSGSTVVTNMDNPLYLQTDTAQDIIFRPNITEKLRLSSTALTFAESVNVVLGTTTGTKIGTAITQKLSFWNATPVIQSTGWTTSNVTSDKVIDANATSLDEVADVLSSLIETLKSYGLLGS